MYKVTPSQLDSFAFLQDHDYASEDDWIASIKSEFVPTEKMAMGTAFHQLMESKSALVEHGEIPISVAEKGKEYLFFFDARSCRAAWDALPPRDARIPMQPKDHRIWEIPGSIKLDVPDFGVVLLSGRLDLLVGSRGYDLKTTANPRAAAPIEALQWQCYCLIFELDSFEYKNYLLYTDKQKYPPITTVYPRDALICYPYNGMLDYIVNQVHDLLSAVRLKGLLDYMAVKTSGKKRRKSVRTAHIHHDRHGETQMKEVTSFAAEDGRRFDSREACETYEAMSGIMFAIRKYVDEMTAGKSQTAKTRVLNQILSWEEKRPIFMAMKKEDQPEIDLQQHAVATSPDPQQEAMASENSLQQEAKSPMIDPQGEVKGEDNTLARRRTTKNSK